VRARARTGLGRFLLAQDAHDLGQSSASQTLRIEGRGAGEQLVEQHTERVHVRARVDVARVDLLGAHVGGRADELARLRQQRVRLEAALDRLGDAEVDHLRLRATVDLRDQHVGRLDVAVDHALVVRVLDRFANLDEQAQAFGRAQLLGCAVLVEMAACDELHREVRPSIVGLARVQDLGDAGMFHQRERTALGVETRQHLDGVHAGLQDRERDASSHRRSLQRLVNRAEAAFADHCRVRTDAGARRPLPRSCGEILDIVDRQPIAEYGLRQEILGAGEVREQALHIGSQRRIIGAGFVEVLRALLRLPLAHFEEDLAHFFVAFRVQARPPRDSSACSQVRAMTQSAAAVRGETPTTRATSSISSPAKKRSSTMRAWRACKLPSLASASSSAGRSSRPESPTTSACSRSMSSRAPGRFCAPLRRA
jgi:hypothetical protein